jgi:tetratricopeptide (TPR) repeat protein
LKARTESAVATARKSTKKKPESAKKKAASRSKRSSTAAAPRSEEEHLELFEKAMEAFRAEDFAKALELFEASSDGPDGPLRHRSKVHARICRQRIGSDTVDLKTADDHYNYAIRLINDRRLDEATDHLNKALGLTKRPAAHVHYGLAVVAALQEDAEESYSKLREAIEIDPQQRLIARRDPDFAGISGAAPIAELLAGDASTGNHS